VAQSLPALGSTVAGYRLERLLGQGAHGTVFLALDTRRQGAVALKLWPATPGTAPDVDLTQARRLANPAIADTYDAGTEGAWHWTAMEPVAGVSLERYTHPARLLPEPLVARIGARIAAGLAHAHAAGVIHRDIKPSNVIVDLPTFSVKITDFGVAREIDGERTRTGVVIGSPVYLAPEQLGGSAPTPSGDLYALGVTLFQLLAGRLPHEGGSMGELLRQVALAPAPDVRELRPQTSAALAELVAQLLAKRPDGRPADARGVSHRLDTIADETTAGGPTSRP
jgi:serine/threonine-protein kinase